MPGGVHKQHKSKRYVMSPPSKDADTPIQIKYRVPYNHFIWIMNKQLPNVIVSYQILCGNSTGNLRSVTVFCGSRTAWEMHEGDRPGIKAAFKVSQVPEFKLKVIRCIWSGPITHRLGSVDSQPDALGELFQHILLWVYIGNRGCQGLTFFQQTTNMKEKPMWTRCGVEDWFLHKPI